MSSAIVGHGWGLFNQGWGRLIDGHDRVIRMTYSEKFGGEMFSLRYPEDFGVRHDYTVNRRKALFDYPEIEGDYLLRGVGYKRISSGVSAAIWAMKEFGEDVTCFGMDNVFHRTREGYCHYHIVSGRRLWEHDAVSEYDYLRDVSEQMRVRVKGMVVKPVEVDLWVE